MTLHFQRYRKFTIACTMPDGVVLQQDIEAVHRRHALAVARRQQPTATLYEVHLYVPVAAPKEPWQ